MSPWQSHPQRGRVSGDRRVRPAGADELLAAHGFRPSRDYVLKYDGRGYDTKAILDVAHRYATGVPLGYAESSGGKSGTAQVLRDFWDSR